MGKPHIFGESVQGASHIRSGKPCQDSFKIDYNNEIILLAVADGHGSDSCPYSKTGSTIAVNTFNYLMASYYANYKKKKNGMIQLMRFLNREGDTNIAKNVEKEWKHRVYKQHLNNHREVPKSSDGTPDKAAIYKMYGTTLLGLVITKYFTFAFQLGDGNISIVSDCGVESLISGDHMLGVETHSLCSKNAWRNAVCKVQQNQDSKQAFMYMMTTDGMANSFATDQDFYDTCKGYYEAIKEHGCELVKDSLNCWLSETSEGGCGDDITAVISYFE